MWDKEQQGEQEAQASAYDKGSSQRVKKKGKEKKKKN